MTDDAALSRSLATDFRTADLSEADRAMLEYAAALTTKPHGSVGHVERLRGVGFDDQAILDICQVTAYYNYVNRIADGLGVELEPHWTKERLTLDRDEFDRMTSGNAS